MIDIVRLNESNEHLYEQFLQQCPDAMLYHSLAYRGLLKEIIPAAEENYLLALDGSQLAGALPTFLVDGPLGPVLNSLPFFGSHGGILLNPTASPIVASALASALVDLCVARQVAFATVIDTPFKNNENIFESTLNFQHGDQRIGQISFLPQAAHAGQVSESLLAMYHQKTRNIVRKAVRGNLTFAHESGEAALNALHHLHETNIVEIGGIPKSKHFFESVASQFEYDREYRVYTARASNGEIVCALMLLYFKDTVEYFVPATAENWRSSQPLSALIHIAMCDAVAERGARRWNWGGTWLNQDGVYHFKSRWGTSDHRYNYYTRVFSDESILQGMDRQRLLKDYPWFYTVPFSALDR